MATLAPVQSTYEYLQPNGVPYCKQVRIEPGKHKVKDFISDPAGLLSRYPLYRYERLVGLPAETTVHIVEGEKCVHALGLVNLPAVTSRGGSGPALRSTVAPLQRFRETVILSDHNKPSAKYARDVVEILNELRGKRGVTVCGLPGGGDVVDFLTSRDTPLAWENSSRPNTAGP